MTLDKLLNKSSARVRTDIPAEYSYEPLPELLKGGSHDPARNFLRHEAHCHFLNAHTQANFFSIQCLGIRSVNEDRQRGQTGHSGALMRRADLIRVSKFQLLQRVSADCRIVFRCDHRMLLDAMSSIRPKVMLHCPSPDPTLARCRVFRYSASTSQLVQCDELAPIEQFADAASPRPAFFADVCRSHFIWVVPDQCGERNFVTFPQKRSSPE